MKLLLHVCCAPCAIHPFAELRGREYKEITGFFYNPNIHPYTEFINRRKSLEEYSEKNKFPVVFHKYDMENYFRHVAGHEGPGTRCPRCWRMRLEETASFGAQKDYDAFTTTLLVSPYQDQEMIRKIGLELSKKYRIDFFYRDLRDGFRKAQDAARKDNLYRQKYCGCVYSEKERYDKPAK
ncbi:MAG: epoxyqueuosine reductase QueH [Candidatus Omnitrophica bacterium]|nr:epoxyqueuosine reductase QueH [Candidatus Omnitrophota bacterium]